MLNNAKALVVVLALALLTFHVCKPIAVQFMREETFARRRNVWLALTVVGFLSPSFWIWAVFALVLLYWAGRKDANPLGVFCIAMFTVPHVSFYVPMPVISQFFALTPSRVLSLAILVPALLRPPSPSERGSRFLSLQAWALAFVALQIATLIPYETVTNTARRTFLLALDVLLVVMAFARVRQRAILVDTMACFWLAVVVMAPMAIFESLRSWLLYTGIGAVWGDPNALAWLFRSGSLRAQVAAAHSINLGYQMAIALTVYLFLRSRRAVPRAVDLSILLVMAGATIVSYSRGAWITALCGLVLYTVLRPDAMRRLPSALGAALAVCALFVFIPSLKEKVVDRLPFIGSQEQDTIDYREQLSDTSWAIVNQNPWFGDPFAILKMESLRQGQGIIDIVNGYLFVALFNGYVGLFLFVMILISGATLGWRAWRASRADAEWRDVVASLLAALVATAIFIATAGQGTTTYLLCGLLAGTWAVMRGHEERASSYGRLSSGATRQPA